MRIQQVLPFRFEIGVFNGTGQGLGGTVTHHVATEEPLGFGVVGSGGTASFLRLAFASVLVLL